MTPLARETLAADAVEIAPWLLNKLLVSTLNGITTAGRIIEVEAYRQDDPASHSFAGRTPRTRTMFGPPGHLYVYLSYGIHRCANVVVDHEGRGAAVLLRAIVPVLGIDAIGARRAGRQPAEWTNGPGKLCQALAIDLAHDGLDLCGNEAVVLVDDGVPPPRDPLVGPRVGITKAVERPWRFRRAE